MSCKKSFHGTCANIDKHDMQRLTNSSNLFWLCATCIDFSKNATASALKPEPLTTIHLNIVLEKINAIGRHIVDIKTSQNQLAINIAKCNTILDAHSNNLCEHSGIINNLQSSQQTLQSDLESIANEIGKFRHNTPSKSSTTNTSSPDVLINEATEGACRAHNNLLITQSNNFRKISFYKHSENVF